MNDLYLPVDVKRLMELAGTRKLPEADVATDYKSSASPEVQANYNKGGQRPDPTDALIANRMGANVPQADLAKAAQTRPEGPTATVPTATAAAIPTPAADRSLAAPAVPVTPAVPAAPVTPAVPAATIRTNPTPATRPAYAGSAGSQAIQKLNPDLIKDVNKIYPGQQFKLPGGGTYTVKKGDTLDAIARSTAAPAAPAPAAPPASRSVAPTARGPFTLQLPYTTDTPAPPGLRTNSAAATSTDPLKAAANIMVPPGDPLRRNATTPAASRSAISRQTRANQQVRETSADLGRMQSLAGIRKS